MKTVSINVQKEFCTECSLALMHFIGKMKGVESITADEGKVNLTFDEALISGDDLLRLTRENIEKLGYRLEDNE